MVRHETIYTNYGESKRYLIEELPCGNVKRTCISNQYCDKDGKVTIHNDPTVVTSETITNGGLLRKAQSMVTGGNRSTRARHVINVYEQLKQNGGM